MFVLLGPRVSGVCALVSVRREAQVSALGVAWNHDAGKAEVLIGLLRTLRKDPGPILGRKEILPMLTGSDKLFLTVECFTINRNSDLVRWLSRDYYFHFMGGETEAQRG